MERCVHKNLYNYITANNLLTHHQSGFIRGDSTVNQLAYIYNDICRAVDDGKEVRAVFCDISKAFDRVWHRGLLFKLDHLGIQGNLLSWFKSYLSARKQRVVYANTSSSWCNVSAGVPQGSILGPLLFLLYINDIVSHINSNIKLFADDTSMYIIVNDPTDSTAIINQDLDTVLNWSHTWLVSFNPSKTETIIFSRKSNKPDHPDLLFNNVCLNPVSDHKHLGLTLSKDCKWNSHITSMVNKAWARLGCLRSFKYTLNKSCLETLYIMFVRPLLEYGDVVWDNCTEQQKSDIEAVQIDAARIITGATKYCNTASLYAELNMQPLTDRRKQHKLTLLFKMKNNLVPNYICNLIPNAPDHRYPLRNQNAIPLIACKTQLYKSSFLPSAIRSWNSLPSTVTSQPTVSSFKRSINPNRRNNSNAYLYAGLRKNQILHTRLRLSCSSLNHDLHRRSLIDSPLCSCGHIETVSHYLLSCTNYSAHRTNYLSNLPCVPTVANLLFGDEHLSSDLNEQVILQVHKYSGDTTL